MDRRGRGFAPYLIRLHSDNELVPLALGAEYIAGGVLELDTDLSLALVRCLSWTGLLVRAIQRKAQFEIKNRSIYELPC